MNKKLSKAGRGITLLYYSQMLVLLSSLCLTFMAFLKWGPLQIISSVLTILGLIFSIIGLSVCAKTHKNFKIAFICSIANLILSFVAVFFISTSLYSLLVSCANVLSIVSTIFVMFATKSICSNKSVKLVGFNKFMIYLYFVVFVIVACINLIYAIGFVDVSLASKITTIITSVGNFCYVHFLKRAKKLLS